MTSTARAVPDGSAPAQTARSRRLSRRHVLLVALLPVLVAVWIPVLLGDDRATATRAPAVAMPPPAAPAGEVAPPGGDATPASDAAALLRRVEERLAPYRPEWSPDAGDPFAATAPPLPGPDAVAPATAAEHRDQRLVPTAVLLSHGELPIAIIGGRACRPGDEVDGCRIVAIEEQRVVFRRGDEVFAASLRQPSLLRKEPP